MLEFCSTHLRSEGEQVREQVYRAREHVLRLRRTLKMKRVKAEKVSAGVAFERWSAYHEQLSEMDKVLEGGSTSKTE